ncbi:hypothetical protein [Clostridium manihotivorum]|nr:hypothetical protein [Clostridium manihotivorum]
MRKSRDLDAFKKEHHSKDKDFNPEPVKIVWNKDSKKPTIKEPEERL